MQPQTPIEPSPRVAPAVGMTVVDTTGEQAGSVTAVQPAGTDRAATASPTGIKRAGRRSQASKWRRRLSPCR